MVKDQLRRNHTEVKYLLAATGVLITIAILSTQHVFDTYQGRIDTTLEQLFQWGLLGVFIGAALANAAVMICIPYTMLVMTVVLVDQSWTTVVSVSLASGIGSALGRLFSYSVLRRLSAQWKSLPDSSIYRWIRHMVTNHPRKIPLLVFAGLTSFLPDEVVVTPMALADYPARKMVLPILTGKVLHTLITILIFLPIASHYGSGTSRTGALAAIILLSILIILYQIEKTQQAKKQMAAISHPATGGPNITCWEGTNS